MKISALGISVIKKWEGLGPEYKLHGVIQAYTCPSDKATIGYGHTAGVTEVDVQQRKQISLEEAEQLLVQDLVKFEKEVSSRVLVPLTQGQFDALVSFCFNVGSGAFAGSTLLRMLNEGKYDEIPTQLRRWVHGDQGKILSGLKDRREDEIKMLWLHSSKILTSGPHAALSSINQKLTALIKEVEELSNA